jgi:NTP pyrophosphatase (non-canonical NTP hydrolase)
MDFSHMSELAMQLRQQYAKLETKNYGKPWTQEQLVLGFVGDVGKLAQLIQAKTGNRIIENHDEKLAHELADCLWSVIVLAKECNIDLQQTFTQTINNLLVKNQTMLES